jgi:hypothetical protein
MHDDVGPREALTALCRGGGRGRFRNEGHGRTLRYDSPAVPSVSTSSSRVIYDALEACSIRLISALPETWLVHLVRMAEEDHEMILVRLAKEEEGVKGIASCAQLYRIPLLCNLDRLPPTSAVVIDAPLEIVNAAAVRSGSLP